VWLKKDVKEMRRVAKASIERKRELSGEERPYHKEERKNDKNDKHGTLRNQTLSLQIANSGGVKSKNDSAHICGCKWSPR